MKKTIVFISFILLIVISITIFLLSYKPDTSSILEVGELIKELEYNYKTSDEIREELSKLNVTFNESVLEYLFEEYAKDEVYELNLSELYATFPPDAAIKNPTNEYDNRIYEKNGEYFIKIEDLEVSDYGLYPVLFMGSIIDLTEWDVYGQKSVDKDILENIYQFDNYTQDRNTYNIIYKSILTNSNLYITIESRFKTIIDISVEKE